MRRIVSLFLIVVVLLSSADAKAVPHRKERELLLKKTIVVRDDGHTQRSMQSADKFLNKTNLRNDRQNHSSGAIVNPFLKNSKVATDYNLTPFQPTPSTTSNGYDWGDKIVVYTHEVNDNNLTLYDATTITTSDSVFLAFSYANFGSVDITTLFYTAVYVDGNSIGQSPYSNNGMNQSTFYYWYDQYIGNLSAGTHTIEIYVDVYNSVSDESNENDNSYSRNRMVGGGISISSPAGGEQWPAGSLQNISFSAPNASVVDIAWRYSNDVTWYDVATRYPISTGNFRWVTRTVPGYTIQLRVRNSDDTTNFVLSNEFSVTDPVPADNNWTLQYSNSDYYFAAIKALDENNAFVVGTLADNSGSVLLKTTDGTNWNDISINLPTSELIFAIEAESPSVAWIGDRTGNIYKTVNGGLSWDYIATIGTFIDGIKLVGGNLVVVSDGPSLLQIAYSTDGGSTWTDSYVPDEPSMTYSFPTNMDVFGNTVYTGTNTGALLKSTDGGVNWYIASQVLSYSYGIGFADDNNGIVLNADAFNNIWRTSDGGTTGVVDLNRVPNTYDVELMKNSNPYVGWIVGSRGLLMQTNDGGNSWTQKNLGMTEGITSLDFTAKNNGWIITAQGSIMRFNATTTEPVISSFSPESGDVGAYVAIYGSNFGSSQGSSTVSFGGISASATYWSDTEIDAQVPPGISGPVFITVTVNGLTGTSSTQFTVSSSTTVSITSFNPTSGPIGSSVTIDGTNFGSSQGTVQFGSVTASISSWTSSEIVATVPSGLNINSAYLITVTTADFQTATSVNFFTVTEQSNSPSISLSRNILLILNNGTSLTFSPIGIIVTNSGGASFLGSISMTGDVFSYINVDQTSLDVSANGGTQTISIIPTGSFASGGTYVGRIHFFDNTNTEVDHIDVTLKVFVIPTTVDVSQSVSFDDPSSATSYKLLSIPGTDFHSPLDVISGNYQSDWRMYRDNGAASDFLQEYDGTSSFDFGPGKGFWVLSRNGASVSGSVTGANPYNGAYDISLVNGWNIIADPFRRAVSWNDVIVYNGLPSNATIYNWDNGSWTLATDLIPFKAYYFNNISYGYSTLSIPYDPNGIVPKDVSQSVNKGVNVSAQHLQVDIESKGKVTSTVFAGFDAHAGNDYDPHDYFAAPSYFSVANIQIENKKLSVPYKRLMIDQRSAVGTGQTFDLVVSNKTSEVVNMTFSGEENFKEYEVFLVDQQHSTMYDLRKYSTISVPPSTNEQHFQLLIGSQSFIRQTDATLVPNEFTLYQNYPNPFNPTTTIGYVLPEQSKVSLKVYDVMGKEVLSLVNTEQPSGYYAVQVNGAQLASGVYYFRLRTDQFSQTKKMVLLK